MDHHQEVLEEGAVEEVIDESEVYGELVEVDGEEMLLEEVDDMNIDEVEYEQVPEWGGYQYVVHGTSNQRQSSPIAVQSQRIQGGVNQIGYMQQTQQERPLQTQHVYAIRGNQVYRVDKTTGVASALRTMPTRSDNLPLYARQPDSHIQSQRTYYSSSLVKPTSSQSSPLPIAYRASEASYQFNRRFTPYLAARMAQKKRQCGMGNRKPCNCTKSMCLKLYCDCFANGEFCKDCNCKDCRNNLENEAERTRAVKLSLERNPNAFKPKIGVAPRGRVDVERLHQKGCHCKKSNCLKNYCECYEAKVPCTDRCKCISCRNTENDRATKFRSKFSAPTDVRPVLGNAQTEMRPSSPFSDEESEAETPEPSDPKTLPWFYMTDEVVEAATLCLVAQAGELESEGGVSVEKLEMAILKEYGRCLGQVIENATLQSSAA